ncbi:hypothetical protein RFI_28664 [Reticulomyxa filosa]|uniref:NACHT domain-containing protein n=1 Tax=Reticulomyxa filosa TaxID=46433 RepID=X6M5H4_RETFI|nr:hypothetical protein RFI_28664 [Reticulomyxa filosa]|eukprot:ETO08722.1 hypothetical protein RFI_28664 [Reticulomyxa filosa]
MGAPGARKAKQNRKKERILVHETSRPKEKNKETNDTNKTSEIKKYNENRELNATKEKLKQCYQSQDKLYPLFDDPEQSIDTTINKLEVRHINIQGEARSGKSALSQRIAYLWGNDQMLNHQFQYLLHIPLRKKIIKAFHHINDNCDDQKKDQSNDDIEYLWSIVMNELHISRWDLNGTKCIINSMIPITRYSKLYQCLFQK